MEFTDEILQIAAVVAALVGILKAYNVDSKHNHIAALVIAAVFVLVPQSIQDIMLKISLIGLTASGAYHYTKKREGN
jgi:Sec-independent protein secretion pathway component TatC